MFTRQRALCICAYAGNSPDEKARNAAHFKAAAEAASHQASATQGLVGEQHSFDNVGAI